MNSPAQHCHLHFRRIPTSRSTWGCKEDQFNMNESTLLQNLKEQEEQHFSWKTHQSVNVVTHGKNVNLLV